MQMVNMNRCDVRWKSWNEIWAETLQTMTNKWIYMGVNKYVMITLNTSTLRVVSVTWAVGMKMDKIVNKVVMLIQGQFYTIDDTTRIYTCRTDSTSTQQEIHNNRATRRYTTGETTEKLLSEKFRSEVRAYRKKGIKFWLVSLIFGLNIISLLLEFNLYNYMKKYMSRIKIEIKSIWLVLHLPTRQSPGATEWQRCTE